MKFIDEIKILVQSGKGGDGCVSFIKGLNIDKKGPNGGNGGKGGNVFIEASSKIKTLYHLKFKSKFKANDGMSGQSGKKTGKSGSDYKIVVPLGTQVVNCSTGKVVEDLTNVGDRFVVVYGGNGGSGNANFKRFFRKNYDNVCKGELGNKLFIILRLKILADVSIIGLPNAGKSTIISNMTSTKFKIGNFSFTTIFPNLGVINNSRYGSIVLADIPGLIKDSCTGKGLGIKFLKHVERTKFFLHVVDISNKNINVIFKNIKIIENELYFYNKELFLKPRILIFNKIDLLRNNNFKKKLIEESQVRGYTFLAISAIKNIGMNNVILKLFKNFNKSFSEK